MKVYVEVGVVVGEYASRDCPLVLQHKYSPFNPTYFTKFDYIRPKELEVATR